MEDFVTVPCLYFNGRGPQYTRKTFEVARERAAQLGIKTIVVATTSGETGVKAAQFFRGYDLVVVSHSQGFSEPNTQELTEANRALIVSSGAKLLTCQHAMGGINRAVRKEFGTYMVDELIAFVLRNFSQGVKVGIEMALMAADAGLVRVGEPVITIAGSSGGADTAMVVLPANAQDFFNFRVLEILCKPRLGRDLPKESA
jgi:hypothetical protein